MIYPVFIVTVPLLTYFVLPSVLTHYSGKKSVDRKLLLAAGVLFGISWFLPSFKIHGYDTSFTSHFVGGGFYTALVWLYATKQLKLKLPVSLELVSLFALVSSLGVLNEFVELFFVEIFKVNIRSIDVWWDLLGNTLGALSLYLVFKLTARFRD